MISHNWIENKFRASGMIWEPFQTILGVRPGIFLDANIPGIDYSTLQQWGKCQFLFMND
jgi:hypothetical protein